MEYCEGGNLRKYLYKKGKKQQILFIILYISFIIYGVT
jgi:hypothetical protein